MMKFRFLFFTFLFCSYLTNAQVKYEREFRIKKSQFPDKALNLIQEKLSNIKKVKYYKEIDSAKISYEAKFKKDRLWYSIEFNVNGALEDIEIQIKDIDIPDESYEQILYYLKQTFYTYKIKKIQQQYVANDNEEETLKIAFQNLITSSINYELVVQGKKNKNSFDAYEILFNAEGKCITLRKMLPPNYDHVLY